MTLPELIMFVSASTGASESEVRARVRAAWPTHAAFTDTQAALMVGAITRAAQQTRKGAQ